MLSDIAGNIAPAKLPICGIPLVVIPVKTRLFEGNLNTPKAILAYKFNKVLDIRYTLIKIIYMSRIFIGLTPDSEFNQKIIDLKIRQKEHQNKAYKISWVPNNNHHITVNFVGSMEPEQIDEMKELLKGLSESLSDVPIEIDGVSYFPNENGQVIIATINLNKSLQRLYDKVEEVVANVGFGMSLRSYKPHITLGRFKDKNRPFSQIIELEKPVNSVIEALDVYESSFKSGKTLHSLVQTYSFE